MANASGALDFKFYLFLIDLHSSVWPAVITLGSMRLGGAVRVPWTV